MFYFLLLFYSTCLWSCPKGFFISLFHVHFFNNGHIEDQTSHGYPPAFEIFFSSLTTFSYMFWHCRHTSLCSSWSFFLHNLMFHYSGTKKCINSSMCNSISSPKINTFNYCKTYATKHRSTTLLDWWWRRGMRTWLRMIEHMFSSWGLPSPWALSRYIIDSVSRSI